jgi:hypothetical protein
LFEGFAAQQALKADQEAWDRFAAAALQAIWSVGTYEADAAGAAKAADAMMVERAKRENGVIPKKLTPSIVDRLIAAR